jgi:hypothetical protein
MTSSKRHLIAAALTTSLLLPFAAQADVYMHNPRGSNNRDTSSASSSLVDEVIAFISSFF